MKFLMSTALAIVLASPIYAATAECDPNDKLCICEVKLELYKDKVITLRDVPKMCLIERTSSRSERTVAPDDPSDDDDDNGGGGGDNGGGDRGDRNKGHGQERPGRDEDNPGRGKAVGFDGDLSDIPGRGRGRGGEGRS